jgi:hypothetical protein
MRKYGIYFVQVTECPVLCAQCCEAQAKSNNNKPKVIVHKCEETIQGWKLYEEILEFLIRYLF